MRIVEFQDKFREETRQVIRAAFGKLDIPAPPHPDSISETDLERISLLYSGKGCFWVALLNDNAVVIGTIGILEQANYPGVAKLVRMAVSPDFWGTETASVLYYQALQFCREQEYKKIFLSTRKVMMRAHAFYERHGFVRVNETAREYHYELVL